MPLRVSTALALRAQSAPKRECVRGACGQSAGAGPAVLALTTDRELPTEALDFGTAHGFAIGEIAVGRPARWGSGISLADS